MMWQGKDHTKGIYHVWDILREFLGYNFVRSSYIKTQKPKKNLKPKNFFSKTRNFQPCLCYGEPKKWFDFDDVWPSSLTVRDIFVFSDKKLPITRKLPASNCDAMLHGNVAYGILFGSIGWIKVGMIIPEFN